MLNFQWPVWEGESDNTKFNTPGPHSHLRPCNFEEPNFEPNWRGSKVAGMEEQMWFFKSLSKTFMTIDARATGR